MDSQAITLHLPENMFHRLQQMAQVIRQPLESVVYQSIQGNLPPLIEDAPDEWRDDAADMEQLNDGDLWKIAKKALPEQQWTRHQELLTHNQDGTLTRSEQSELEKLRTATDRFVFRRSYAMALLKWRGYAVIPPMSVSS